MRDVSIKVAGEELVLDGMKTLFWPKEKILFIADLHIGKVSHFRKSGIAVPIDAATKNFKTLDEQIVKYSPKEVVFLGDLFHSLYNAEWEALLSELSKHSDILFSLVMGNHDILPDEAYRSSMLQIHEKTWIRGPFLLSHHPLEEIADGLYNLCGHLHPGVLLHGKARQRLRLPCFYFGVNQGILPAFGTFTGISIIESTEDSLIYGIAENQLIHIE